MSHRKLLTLALTTAGVLAMTAINTPASVAEDTGATETTQASSADQYENSVVTIVVQLTDDAPALADMKERVNAAVAAAVPGASATGLREYTHALRGFAITAPASSLAAIRATPGVKAAFMDRHSATIYDVYQPNSSDDESQGKDHDPSLSTAMDMTAAAQATHRGSGQVIEIIDTGFDTSHSAFAGSVEGTRLSQADVTSLAATLGEGRGGGWVSAKIPFAYDYADGDADVTYPAPGEFPDQTDDARYTHGTHVAALAAANGSEFRGAAPDAQLIMAKVLGNDDQNINDSVLLAALDDAAVLTPDVLVVSVGDDSGQNGDALAVYADVYAALADKGIAINAPAGDYTSSAWGNWNSDNLPFATDADFGAIIWPALDSNALATASLDEVKRTDGQPLPDASPSYFSSWGVTPDLRLKPEIAAPGGDVMSALPAGTYGRRAGTAEASAQVAGIAALVRQRIADDPMFAGMSAADKDAVVANFLMGTAHPVVDATQADGAFYSPRQVGSGLVDAVAATTSPVYPSVVGAANPSRPKADLGDGTNGWSFQVQLTNVSDAAHTYTLGGQALSPTIEGNSFTFRSTNWTNTGIGLAFSTDSVTVPAKSSVTVTVTVTPKSEFASYANANATKGTFIDGAVTFTSAEGQPDLTVPYMGFYGSWGDPSVFDGKWDGNENAGVHLYGSTLKNLTSSMPLGDVNPLYNHDDIREAQQSDPDLFYVSRSEEYLAPSRVGPSTYTLRPARTLTYSYLNEAGTVVRSYTRSHVRASLHDHELLYGLLGANVEDWTHEPSFDGYDEAGNELPDGSYKLVIEAETYAPSNAKQQLTWDFTLDTKAPVVSNMTMVPTGENAYSLSFDVTDSAPIAGCGISMDSGKGYVQREYEEEPAARGEDGLFHAHYDLKDVPFTAVKDKGDEPSTLSLDVWDWAKNKGTTKLPSSLVPMTKLSVSPALVSLVVGESVTLSVSHEPVDATVTSVVWSSSDEAVATVSADGVVSAVGVGDATITVADPTQPSVMASATIHVNAPVPAPKAGVWKRGAHGWWYRYEDGSYPSNATLVIDGSTYRFDASGYMRTGWVKDQGAWYYHEASGAQASGWVFSGARWYYLSPDSGVMATGWVQVGSTWYYLSPDSGAMATGWLKEGGYWYYLQPGSGAMVTGWLKIWGTWYHFADNGQLIS
ncbi:MAG: S8 family serine peptidase [Actinomyces sp.]|nr:S8 family serine peptidase [Actinomyces sp.]